MLLLMIIVGVGGAKADEITFDFDCSDGSALADKGLSSSPTNGTVTQKISGTSYTWKATGTTNQPGSGTFSVAKNQNGLQLGSKSKPLGNYTFTLQTELENVTKIVVKAFAGLANNTLVAGVGETAFGEPITLGQKPGEGIYTFEVSEGKTGQVVISGNDKNSYIRIQTITITYGTSSSLHSADLSFGETTSYNATLGESFTAPTLAYAEGFDGNIEYLSSKESVATVNATTGEVSLVGAGTTTITASFAGNDTYAAGSASYTLTVVDPNAPGTENNPFTIEQAITYINSDSYNASDVVYVKGIISQIDSYNSNYKSITYWISDDGTDKNQFECYSGRGLGNSDFNSVEDLEQGDVVVVCGTVKKFNSTYEFNYNNYIVSLKRKATPTLSFAEETYSVVKNGNMTITATTNSDGTISYESSDPDVAEIDASTGVVTAKAAGTTTITATVAATDTYKAATATVELTVTAPKHKATFYQNGEKLSEAEFTEDATIEFPDAMATILGKQFVGWLPAEIEGTTNEASPIKAATMGTADVTYYAVYAYVEGEEKTSTLTNDDIKEYFTKEKPSYGTLKSYSDEINGVTWSASCTADAEERPWIQIKKEADNAYFKVNTEGNIANIKLTITSATNDKGGVTDITKHKAFDGTVYMEETASASPEGALGSSSDITDNSVTLVPTSPVKEVIIQVSAAARIWDAEVTYGNATYSGYCTTLTLAAPTFSPAAGEVEKGKEVTISAEEGAKVKYTIGETTTTAESNTVTVTINEDVTIKAVAVKDGVESEEVSAAYTVKAEEPVVDPGTPAAITAGFYTIKNLGNENEKFVNVAGRKTATLVDNAEGMAGTVIQVESDADGIVKTLRSQGVDVPGYATRAMKYVPDVVKLVVEKLHVSGSGEILGETGVDKILDKFNKSVDVNLHVVHADGGYRIYGKTPSMTPVKEFYLENKANVDAKLPGLEQAINDAIATIVDKVGKGESLKNTFKLETIWQRMGWTEYEPGTKEATQVAFLQQVLANEENIWNFAYQTAMFYMEWVEGKQAFQEMQEKAPELMKYWNLAKKVRPNFMYYIVQKDGKVDVISQGNEAILNNDKSTVWALEKVSKFKVNLATFVEKTAYPTSKDGETISYKEYYGTLYTDFAYRLPEGVTAYKVTGINKVGDKAYVKKAELNSEVVPAQTPVLLIANIDELTLTIAEGGEAVADNQLYGNDYLINEYDINTPQLEFVFNYLAELSQSTYDKYEYLMRKNAGTVNNKYFFGIAVEGELNKAYKDKTGKEMESSPVLKLGLTDGKVGFFETWDYLAGNEGFMFSEEVSEILMNIVGDVNRDGTITISDVTALVNIILGKATYPADADKYDFEAADVNTDKTITIADVTALVNIILGK